MNGKKQNFGYFSESDCSFVPSDVNDEEEEEEEEEDLFEINEEVS